MLIERSMLNVALTVRSFPQPSVKLLVEQDVPFYISLNDLKGSSERRCWFSPAGQDELFQLRREKTIFINIIIVLCLDVSDIVCLFV